MNVCVNITLMLSSKLTFWVPHHRLQSSPPIALVQGIDELQSLFWTDGETNESVLDTVGHDEDLCIPHIWYVMKEVWAFVLSVSTRLAVRKGFFCA